MISLYMIFVAVCIAEIATDDIQRKIKTYFESETAKSFHDLWKKHEIAFESAIKYGIQDGYGHTSMNVYIHRSKNPLAISTGYYHTDNQVQIVFQNMDLEEVPYMYDIDITFPLYSNVLSVDASISKMIVHTSYILFRNKTDIVFSMNDQDPLKSSPFRFQQVRNVGELAITIEGCILSGVVVAKLSDTSANLGHSKFKLSECQYILEIYSTGTGAPPVIAQYLPKEEKGLNIDHLIMRPLLEQLVPKLQASLFSYVNASAVFTNKLNDIRVKQESIFDETLNNVDKIVRSMNKKSIEKNMGTIKMGDFSIVWNDEFEELPQATSVLISNMVLMGLDTVYSSHTGGPYKLTEIEIIEQLRFSRLQVIGSIAVKEFQDDNEFAVEISDFAVDVTLDSNNKASFDVVGWRDLEFSCPSMEFLPVESVVVGYLLSEIPKHIISHLNSVFNAGDSLSHPLVYQHDEEASAFDGAQVDEILGDNDNDQGKIQLSMEISDEELVLREGQVKLNNIDAVPHEEGQGQVQLNDKKEVSHEEQDVKVKLNHVDVVHDDEGNKQVKLNHKGVAPHIEEHVKVKLNHVDVEPHIEEHGKVKLNHVEVVHHTEKNGRLKLNRLETVPHEESHVKVKLNHVEAVPHDEKLNKKILQERRKKATKNKLLTKRKERMRSQKQQTRKHVLKSFKQIKPIKRANRQFNQVTTDFPISVSNI